MRGQALRRSGLAHADLFRHIMEQKDTAHATARPRSGQEIRSASGGHGAIRHCAHP
jgi:hypothetical protein